MEKITLCGDNCCKCPRYLAKTNGELEKVAELLKRNEAAAIPTTDTQTAGTNEEYRKFDMNEFL